MSAVSYTNFTSGLVSPKLAGNYTSSIYHSGCSVLENFLVMLQGGITRRPPLAKASDAQGVRLIPFTLDVDRSYAVELGYGPTSGWFRMWSLGEDGSAVNQSEGTTPFSLEEIPSVQFAQSNDTMYLVHRSHTPQKLHTNAGKWQMDSISPYLVHAKGDDGGDSGIIDDIDNIGMLTSDGDHPGCVAYCYNRLWFASSDKHPYRLWSSRPFEPENFEMYDLVKVVDDTTTAQDIIDAIEAGQEDISVSPSYTWRKTIREDNAMRLDAESNDAIRWIASRMNLVVGTSSGESVIPGTCNALNQTLSPISTYGSAKGIQALNANSEVLFVQSGGRRLRSLVYSSDGYSVLDLTYQCDRIFAAHGGVVSMAWRRVPEPTLYVVLHDGTLAVLSYDRGYGLCAWAHWSFPQGLAMDVCVLDSEIGQNVLLLMDRNGSISIERLSDVDAADSMDVQYKDLGSLEYESEVETNPYEVNSSSYGSSLGKKKRMRSIVCRLYMSKSFVAGYGEKYMKPYRGDTGLNDREVLLPGGYEGFVKMKVKSQGGDALTLLAFAVETEVER